MNQTPAPVGDRFKLLLRANNSLITPSERLEVMEKINQWSSEEVANKFKELHNLILYRSLPKRAA